MNDIIKDIHNAIDTAFEKDSYFSISPSTVFDCVAKNIYKLNKIEPDISNETFYPLIKGEALHLLLEQRLSLDPNYSIEKEIKIPITIGNFTMNGKIDLVIKKPKTPRKLSYIVDYKFVSSNAFYYISEPRFKDEGQMNLYIHGYNQLFPNDPVHGALLVYIMDENVSNKKFFFIGPNPTFLNIAEKNINLIQNEQLVRTTPPEQCSSCEYKNKCQLLPINIPKTENEIQLPQEEADIIRDAYEKYKMAEQYLENIKNSVIEKYKNYKKITGYGINITYTEPSQKEIINYEKLVEEIKIPQETLEKFKEIKTKNGYYTLRVK